MTNLGKKTFWTKVELILLTPFWLLSPERKPWDQFKNSLIKHECEFDHDNPDTHEYYPCKHYGCNFVSSMGKDGLYNWQR